MRRVQADANRSADTHLHVLDLPADWGVHVYLKDESVHPTGSLKHRLARSLFLYGLASGWVTEGIADYVRHKYGVDNKSNNWSLPAYSDKQHYTNAYRVTARFFVWLENRANRQLIRRLDTAMRDGKYAEAFWKEQTGHDLDTLWACYQKAPELTGGLVNLNKLAEEITKEKGK